MSPAKQSPNRKRLKKTVPVLRAAAGLSLSLASGASAAPAPDMPTPHTGAGHEIILAEEEISDVSLATFLSSTKKTPQHSVPIFSSPEADVVVAVAGAEGAAVAGVRGCAAVEDVEVGRWEATPAFGPTGAAEAARCALDVHQSGGVSRRRLQRISIRRRVGHH